MLIKILGDTSCFLKQLKAVFSAEASARDKVLLYDVTQSAALEEICLKSRVFPSVFLISSVALSFYR